jgi:hypothetical protein
VNITSCSSETRTIIANATAATSGFRLVYECNTKRTQFVTYDGVSTAIAQTVPFNGGLNPPSIEGGWHHVAVVVNATMSSAFIYVDGAMWNDVGFSSPM